MKIKRVMISFLFSLFIPLTTIFALTDKVYIGGENVGIEVKTNGVLVVGLYEVNNDLIASSSNINSGDYIVEVNGNKIVNIDDFSKEIDNDIDKEELDIKVKRNNDYFDTKLRLVNDNNEYKTGLYVKDSVSGIGTLSFIDPTNNRFFCLGHQIEDNTTNEVLDIDGGSIYYSYITSIDRSSEGDIGEKEAISDESRKYGTITNNTMKGIFGSYESDLSNKKLYEITPKENIKLGKATFLTVTSNEDIKEYSINIDSINLRDDLKNIAFSVTDEELIASTGGIVQGMSGSPIIQDGKIIGVITHVIVNDPKKGYGIFIENMLEEAEKE